MAQRVIHFLTARNLLLRGLRPKAETQILASHFALPFQVPQTGHNSPFIRSFASTAPSRSLIDQQVSVIAPSGGGGPILRTPVYAIFELGSKQYKVSPGDVVWVERLELVDVGAQLALNKVQVAGSPTETIVGRPYIENASVTAVVEEQVQDAKVIIFKKRRRKNSRRLNGHRQLLTGLRITGVNGIMAPETSRAEVVVG